MTTRVTIDAHAGWPVEVKLIMGEEDIIRIVEPNTVENFYIHDGQSIASIRELERNG